MKPLDALLRYFTTGTAEGDRQFLDRVFITPEQMASILEIPVGSPRVLTGNKGVGKTAILEHLHKSMASQDIPALFIRPDDLDTSALVGNPDIATIKRAMHACLLASIATHIGGTLKGFLKGHAATLYSTAVTNGGRAPDWGTSLLAVLSELSKPTTKVDGARLAVTLAVGKSNASLNTAVTSFLETSNRLFLLLIDDTDQIASLNSPGHLNRIWGLILAVRKLTQECPHIRAIISLRTEVWMHLTRADDGQRDQTDHIRPLIVTLRASDPYMSDILTRRLYLAAEDAGAKNTNPWSVFFDSKTMTLPMSDDQRPWESFILKSARERPRDMIQLVAHMARVAKKRGREQISAADAEEAMGTYSKERAEDLAVEVGAECSVFLSLVETFHAINFDTDFESLRRHIRSIPSRFSVNIRGRTLREGNDDDAILLLALLHEAGFINPRVSDHRHPRLFRHITFLDDPHFVQISKWNAMQAARWEVHPAFRTHLLSVKADKKWA